MGEPRRYRNARKSGGRRGILKSMAAENVATVKRAIAAVNARDVDSYLACCTDDVRLRTPLAPIEGSYEGAAGIRRFFSDVAATGPDFRLEIERIDAVGPNRVL